MPETLVRVGTGVPVVVGTAATGAADGTALGCGFGSSRPPDGIGSCGSATTIVGSPVRCGNSASSTYVTASTATVLPIRDRAQRRGGRLDPPGSQVASRGSCRGSI